MKSLQEAYNSIYNEDQELREEVAEFCNEFFFDTEEETEYFVEELFKEEELAIEFFDDILEFLSEFQLNEDTYITEVRGALIKQGLKLGQGLLRKATPAVRGMSAKTLTKRGIQSGGLTQKGTRLAATNKPALATQTRAIQTARATRKVGMPAPEQPGKYIQMLNQKRGTKLLPSSGGTSAQSVKAITQRGTTRHNQAVAQLQKAAQQKVSQTATVAQAFMKSMKQGAASSKLAAAAKGTKNIGPATPVPNKPVTGLIAPASKKGSGGLIGTRNVETDIAKVSRKYGLDAPAPVPAWGGGKTGTGYPKASPKSKGGEIVKVVRPELSKKVKDALPSTRGGALVKSGSGMVPSDGGPVIPTKVKVLTPPTPKLSGGPQKSLPTSNIVKSTTKSGTKTGLRKRDIALGLGAAALGYGVTKAIDDSTRKKVDLDAPTTLADREPQAPKVEPKVAPPTPKVVKPKETVAPSTKKEEPKTAPKATTTKTSKSEPKATTTKTSKSEPKATTTTTPKSEPKVTAKEIRKKMTKIDRDVEELMQMRAASLDRQGRSKEAEKLRGEIKQKYSGYER